MLNEERVEIWRNPVVEDVKLDPCVMFKRHLGQTPYGALDTHPFFYTHIHGQKGYITNHTQVNREKK